MPKMKTRKAVSERIKVKKKRKNGKTTIKFEKRHDGQDHFNARESGNAGRRKKSDNIMSHANKKAILQAVPYT